MTSYPAQIVFIESDHGNAWVGRLLNPSGCVDTQHHGRPVSGSPYYFIEEGHDGRFYATMQGRAIGGRRYRTFRTLTEAQRAGIRWAGRRFRVISEP